MSATWPIDWPTDIDVTTYDPYLIQIAEEAASATLRLLTLYRVGGLPITVMPCTGLCAFPRLPFSGPSQSGNSYLPFYPILLSSGAYANCFCGNSCQCEGKSEVLLGTPVGRIDDVSIDGVSLPTTAYRVENGNILVRLDGAEWPSCSGDDFTVTYLNSYEVDILGQAAGGYLAAEYLKLFGPAAAKCRLPRGVTSVTRQGMQFEVSAGMFPNGVTNIPEVDVYIAQWNPHGLRTRPMVYSPDLPAHRSITWRP